VRAAMRGFSGAQLIAIADPELLQQAAHVLRMPVMLHRYDSAQVLTQADPGHLWVAPIRLQHANEFGFLRQANAHYVLSVLARAAAGCMSGEFDALVTAPLHKGVINDAGVAFSGHTEHLQRLAGVERVVMLLSAGAMRVALATTHLPLRQVADAITQPTLQQTLRVIDQAMRRDFALPHPRIGVLGLNPHAGEQGHLGREELDVIVPALAAVRAEGIHVLGPWPGDTAFIPERLKQADVLLAMYHDQGLAPLKAQGFGQAVNITLGLPFIRTSVDHGTALDIAGKGVADPSSLFAAIAQAIQMAQSKSQRS
jgi:4-hydroxythreonine-4-phosphate dehydrogenase